MYTLTDKSHKSVTNSQFVTFLDVTLDLTNGKYMPYTKANNPSLRSQEIKPSTTNYWQHSTIHQQTPVRDFIYDEESFIKDSSVY